MQYALAAQNLPCFERCSSHSVVQIFWYLLSLSVISILSAPDFTVVPDTDISTEADSDEAEKGAIDTYHRMTRGCCPLQRLA